MSRWLHDVPRLVDACQTCIRAVPQSGVSSVENERWQGGLAAARRHGLAVEIVHDLGNGQVGIIGHAERSSVIADVVETGAKAGTTKALLETVGGGSGAPAEA